MSRCACGDHLRLSLARARLRQLPSRLTLGIGIVLVVLGVAVLGPLLSPYQFDQIIANDSLGSPSLRHLFGADDLGRDVLVRVAAGYRIYGPLRVDSSVREHLGINPDSPMSLEVV